MMRNLQRADGIGIEGLSHFRYRNITYSNTPMQIAITIAQRTKQVIRMPLSSSVNCSVWAAMETSQQMASEL